MRWCYRDAGEVGGAEPVQEPRRRRRYALLAVVAATVVFLADGSVALVVFTGGDNSAAGPAGQLWLPY